MTKSTMTRMPRDLAVRTSSTKSPSVPRRGSTPKKSVMSYPSSRPAVG